VGVVGTAFGAAVPGLGIAFVAGRYAKPALELTGWNLLKIGEGLKADPTKVCAVMSKMGALGKHCLPGARWGAALPPPPTNVAPKLLQQVPPEVAIAVLAVMIVSAGAAYYWHTSKQQAAFDQAFCPKGQFEIDPSFHSSEMNAAGMPHCHGYSRVSVPVDCSAEDSDCRHAACQQACCDSKGCTDYQFNNRMSVASYFEPFVCYLKKKQVTETSCERRWFGELRNDFDPEKDTKTQRRWLGLSSRWIPDPERKEETWVAAPELSHQVLGLQQVKASGPGKVCAASDSQDACEREQCRQACVNTQFCIFFQYQRGDAASYRPKEGDDDHAFKSNVKHCSLGVSQKIKPYRSKFNEYLRVFKAINTGENPTNVTDAGLNKKIEWKKISDFHTKKWHGGKRVAGERIEWATELPVEKKAGNTKNMSGRLIGDYMCPASGEDSWDCEYCPGFSLTGEPGRCNRAPEEAICDPSSWENEYKGLALNEADCVSLTGSTMDRRVPVAAPGMTVDSICAAECCSDPQCVLYQVRSDDAMTKFTAGQEVVCRLGMEHSAGNPKFKCERNADSLFEGKYLGLRGCPTGTFSCLNNGKCVNGCKADCIGAPVADTSGQVSMCSPDKASSTTKDAIEEVNQRRALVEKEELKAKAKLEAKAELKAKLKIEQQKELERSWWALVEKAEAKAELKAKLKIEQKEQERERARLALEEKGAKQLKGSDDNDAYSSDTDSEEEEEEEVENEAWDAQLTALDAESYNPEEGPLVEMMHEGNLEDTEEEEKDGFSAEADDGEPVYHLTEGKDGLSDEETRLAMELAAETMSKIEQNKEVSSDGHACPSITIGSDSCVGETNEETGNSLCRCRYDREMDCKAFFPGGSKQLNAISLDQGMVLIAGEGCACQDKQIEGEDYTCTFELMSSVPTLKLSPSDPLVRRFARTHTKGTTSGGRNSE